jgi:hypothetical protein
MIDLAITSLLPRRGEKMSKHALRSSDVAGLSSVLKKGPTHCLANFWR